jgi:hypothetical protein
MMSSTYRGAAVAILAHVLLMYAAFTVLAVNFDFPDVLRRPAAERLDLFQQVQRVVRPTYWVLTLTGFTQIAVAVLLNQTFRDRWQPVAILGMVFGIVAGRSASASCAGWCSRPISPVPRRTLRSWTSPARPSPW